MRKLDLQRGNGGRADEMGTKKRRSSGVDLAVLPSPSSSSFSLASTSSVASSPRSLFSRWFQPLRNGGGGLGSTRWYGKKKIKKGKREEEVKGGVVVSSPAPEPAAVARDEGMTGVPLGDKESSAELSVSRGGKAEDASFNLGMGAGLILLLATCGTELSRMIEMQREMEALLKEIKDVAQKKGAVPGFSESNNSIVSSASCCCYDGRTNKTLALQNYGALDRERTTYTMVSDGLSNCDRSVENRSCPKMDELEAELEIELERLQLNLEEEGLAVLSGPCGMETQLDQEKTDPSESFNVSFGEDDKCNEEPRSELCGVSAFELEGRLHELLEAKQGDRIAELESALECAESKLQEKEIEASWWRDTAKRAERELDETLLR